MAFKIDGIEVITDTRQLANIARLDEPAIANINGILAPHNMNSTARYPAGITFRNSPAGINDTLDFAFIPNNFDVDVDSTLTVGDTIILGGFTSNFNINGFDCNNLNNRIVAISGVSTANNTISIVTLMDGQDDAGTGSATFIPAQFGRPYIREYVASPSDDFITIREVLQFLS
jgi:hypothetical protein